MAAGPGRAAEDDRAVAGPGSPGVPSDGRLRAVILLAGNVRRSPFSDAIGRAILDLPIASGRTLLDHWVGHLQELAARTRSPARLPVRVAVDRTSEPPDVSPRAFAPSVELELVRDPGEYRGTAGVVRDLTREYADDDLILVATANQILQEPLAAVYAALRAHEEGVSVVPHGDGDLSGLFLLRCDRMQGVPEIGFVDLKEQALPAARGRPSLGVSRRAAHTALPVRTLEEYIAAVRTFHGAPGGGRPGIPQEGPYAETWRSVFALAEDGSDVAPGAALQDSVVLAGGRVEPGATLVRSIVCDGGVVRTGQCLVDTMVTSHA